MSTTWKQVPLTNSFQDLTGLEEYLILLSVCQTCKYMGVDFLDFLRSGEKDIHAFADDRSRRRRWTGSNDTTAIKSSVSGAGNDPGK